MGVRLFCARSGRMRQWQNIWNYRERVSGQFEHWSKYCKILLAIWTLIGLLLFRWSWVVWNHPSEIGIEIHPEASRRLLSSSTDESNLVYDVKCELVNKTETVAVPWDGCAVEKATSLPGLFIFIYVLLAIILFIGTAIVCDDFFVPSLEVISEKLKLSEDVAGATFMAAGSSAPELFSSLAAVSFESEVGVGTIVGSAVFNILFIIAMSVLFSHEVLQIDWRPIVRDSTFYAISLIWFIYASLDTLIEPWEPVVMLLIYASYIFTMFFNKKLMTFMANSAESCGHSSSTVTPSSKMEETDQKPLESKMKEDIEHEKMRKLSTKMSRSSLRSNEEVVIYHHDRRNSLLAGVIHPTVSRPTTSSAVRPRQQAAQLTEVEGSNYVSPEENRCPPAHDVKVEVNNSEFDNQSTKEIMPVTEEEEEEQEEEEEELQIKCNCLLPCCPPVRGYPPTKEQLDRDLQEKREDENAGSCAVCTVKLLFCLKWILFVLAFPFLVIYSWTIPDCSKPHNKKWFWLSFTISIAWIALLSFAMVAIVSRTGCLMNVNPFVMSLVVLAIGTSLPDMMSTIIVARGGYGDMAISNVIGSNVFDINIGLGIPFLIRIMINVGRSINFFSHEERKAYCTHDMLFIPHVKFGIILIAILAFALIIFTFAKFRLNKFIGITFFFSYMAFLVYAFVQQFICTKNNEKYNC